MHMQIPNRIAFPGNCLCQNDDGRLRRQDEEFEHPEAGEKEQQVGKRGQEWRRQRRRERGEKMVARSGNPPCRPCGLPSQGEHY